MFDETRIKKCHECKNTAWTIAPREKASREWYRVSDVKEQKSDFPATENKKGIFDLEKRSS